MGTADVRTLLCCACQRQRGLMELAENFRHEYNTRDRLLMLEQPDRSLEPQAAANGSLSGFSEQCRPCHQRNLLEVQINNDCHFLRSSNFYFRIPVADQKL